MLLLDEDRLEERRRLVQPGAVLAPLYDSLTAELAPWLGRDLYVPEQKSMLSREGGRCADDGTTLEFDPAQPNRHRCPRCGRVFEGELHHRAWITFYQLWLAERAVHGALFFALRGEQRHARFSHQVLEAFADRYLSYPNQDNVLGPTRLFFSTYLESIWLIQICVAADLLRAAGDDAIADDVVGRIVEPSRALIGGYNEGLSNRQVWNNAALMAAAALCGDAAALHDRVHGSGGLRQHLDAALYADGTWYEGENYHQFALRGLWYGVRLAEGRGEELSEEERRRFDRAFAAPFLTALPDFTMPSRKDSQYAVSLRQWRLAELTELGLARTRDPVLADALGRMYEPGHERRDTGRSRSSADVERNAPSGALGRSDLSWRALLHALPELPAPRGLPPRSAHLDAQGYAVFRREGDVYVGFDYGQSGGGHGHPDRLNLTLYRQSSRVLDDLGTGSYVDPSLHWYRSTLAHNAPLANGGSQPLGDGRLEAYDEREGLGVISASFTHATSPADFRRSVTVGPDYLVDELEWRLRGAGSIALPLHLDGEVEGLGFAPRALEGAGGLEDGFDFLDGVEGAAIPANAFVRLEAGRTSHGHRVTAWLSSSSSAELFRAGAPGQPAAVRRRLYLLRTPVVTATGETAGTFRSVIAWGERAIAVRFGAGGAVVIEYGDGERHEHVRSGFTWHTDLFAGGARSSIDLGGRISRDEAEAHGVEHRQQPRGLRPGVPERFALGRDHYRRSESSWEDAGSPTGDVSLLVTGARLVIGVEVRAGERVFAPADATNPFDNEHPDTMSAGVQLHIEAGGVVSGWMLVPVAGSERVRVREITAGGPGTPMATWTVAGSHGYDMRIELPLPDAVARGELPLGMDLIINETVSGRRRRRGQLVLSGARGESVYLRGDRQAPERFLRFEVAR